LQNTTYKTACKKRDSAHSDVLASPRRTNDGNTDPLALEKFKILQKTCEDLEKKQMHHPTVHQLITAIFKGEDKRQKKLTYIHDELKTDLYNGLKIQLPEDLRLILLSYLPEDNVDNDKERTELIDQVKREFYNE